MARAGLPVTTVRAATSCVTTAPAPTMASSPIVTPQRMVAPEPIRIYDKRVTDEVISPSFIDTFASFRASVREGDITIPKVAMGEPLKAECDHFLDCVEFGKVPITGGRDGLAVVDTLEAIERSVAGGGREEAVVSR